MSKEALGKGKERGSERLMKFGRDFNVAVGAVALAGTVLVSPAVAAGLTVYGAFNLAQAGGFEAARRHLKKKRLPKT